MKKIILLCMVTLLTFSITACKKQEEKKENDNKVTYVKEKNNSSATVAETDKQETTKVNENVNIDTNIVVYDFDENPSYDGIHVNEDDYMQTIDDWAERKTEWYKDVRGMIYINTGYTFKMKDILYTFGSPETLGWKRLEEGKDTEFTHDVLVVPVKVKNTLAQEVAVLPNQFVYRAKTVNYCVGSQINTPEVYENDLLGSITLAPNEEKMLYAYIPYAGEAKADPNAKDNGLGFYEDRHFNYQILGREFDKKNFSVTLTYFGPISNPNAETAQNIVQAGSQCNEVIPRDE